MKTEFERISEIMYTLLEHQPAIDVPYEKINDIAVALVKEGYGDVSEYKTEIERLKANGYRSIMYAFENNRDKIVENIQTEIDDYKQSIKQAQIDVLNKLKGKYGFYTCCSWGHSTKLLGEIIDRFIEEIQNEN